MALTYGEQLLAQAEERVRVRTHRRRSVMLMIPAAATILWALADLLVTRHTRLSTAGAGFVRYAIDHVQVLAWSLPLVLLPAVWALKRDPVPGGIVLSALAGPVVSPTLFGPGGWTKWQIAVLVLVTWLVLAAAFARRTARRLN